MSSPLLKKKMMSESLFIIYLEFYNSKIKNIIDYKTKN